MRYVVLTAISVVQYFSRSLVVLVQNNLVILTRFSYRVTLLTRCLVHGRALLHPGSLLVLQLQAYAWESDFQSVDEQVGCL